MSGWQTSSGIHSWSRSSGRQTARCMEVHTVVFYHHQGLIHIQRPFSCVPQSLSLPHLVQAASILRSFLISARNQQQLLLPLRHVLMTLGSVVGSVPAMRPPPAVPLAQDSVAPLQLSCRDRRAKVSGMLGLPTSPPNAGTQRHATSSGLCFDSYCWHLWHLWWH